MQSAWRVPDHKFNEVESALRKARVRSYGGSNSTTPTGSLAPTPVGTPSAAAAAHTPDVVPSAQPATSPPSAGSQKSVSMLKVDDVTLGLADHTPTTARAIADFNSPLPKHDPPTTMADHTPTTARAIAGLNSPLPNHGPPTTTSTTRLGAPAVVALVRIRSAQQTHDAAAGPRAPSRVRCPRDGVDASSAAGALQA